MIERLDQNPVAACIVALLALAAVFMPGCSPGAPADPSVETQSEAPPTGGGTTIADLEMELESVAKKYEPEAAASQLALEVERFLDSTPRSAEAFRILGQAIRLMEVLPSTAEAARELRYAKTPAEAFAKAHALDPENGTYLLDWVQAAPDSGEARAALERYLALHPDDSRACLLAARRKEIGKDRAIELLRRVKECLPEAKLLLGQLLEDRGDLAGAEEAYRQGAEPSCGNPTTNWLGEEFLHRGLALFRLSRVALARGDAMEALRRLRLFDGYRYDMMTPIVADADRDKLWKQILRALPRWPLQVPTRAATPEEALRALRLAALAADDEAFLRFVGPPLVPRKAGKEVAESIMSSCIGVSRTLPETPATTVCWVWAVVFEVPGEFECRTADASHATCRDVSAGIRERAQLDLRLDGGRWRVVAVRSGSERTTEDD